MINDNYQSNNDCKISYKDIYLRYWECRDFDLSHLWQRSIFLTAFIVLCFTAYGVVILKIVDDKNNFEEANIFAFIISVIGVIFSSLRIMMAKSSKAWYERYELAARAMEKNIKYSDEDAIEIGGLQCDRIDGFVYPKTRKNLFFSSGGQYSMSGINIAIGQIALILWIIAIVVHIVLMFKSEISKIAFLNNFLINNYKYMVLGLGCIILAAFFICIFCKKIHWLHSDLLDELS